MISRDVSEVADPPDHPPLFVAKYEYKAREKDDLPIKTGDLLFIVDSKEDGWWLYS